MTLLLCALLLLFGVIVWLLLMPLLVLIDTFNGILRLRWGPIRAELVATEEDLRYGVRAPFFRRDGSVWDLRPLSRKKEVKRTEAVPPKRSSRSLWIDPRQLAVRIIRSFTVRRFHWDLDTGDVLWNAWLFPFFHLWRMHGHDVRIVFTGRHGLLLELRNNAFRLLMAVLSTFIHQPKTNDNEQGHQ